MRTTQLCLVVLVGLSLAGAAGGADRVWVHSPVGFYDGNPTVPPIDAGKPTLVMRGGNAWPTVAYAYGNTGPGTAAMTPVGWVAGPELDPSLMLVNGAGDGAQRAAFVSDTGEAWQLTATGWSQSTYGDNVQDLRPGVAYDGLGRLTVLHKDAQGLKLSVQSGQSWAAEFVMPAQGSPLTAESLALAYDSYGQANVAFNTGGELQYGIKGALTGDEWVLADALPFQNENMNTLDLALGGSDIPWVAYAANGTLLNLATFDRQASQWTTMFYDDLYMSFGFDLAADGKGGVGLAYVDDNHNLVFSYHDAGGSGWSREVLAGNVGAGVALDFDEADNPVICYRNGNENGLYLAYDPVVTPEPGTLALLAAGLVACRRRRG